MLYTEWKNYPDLEDAYRIRKEVFVEEQGVPIEEEIDELDKVAEHIVVYDNGQAVGTGRLVLTQEGYLIGRIAVLKEQRGQKFGDLIVRLLVRKAFDMGGKEVVLHAQIQAIPFYQKIGFVEYGDEYLDAGIRHISMKKTEDVGCNCRK